jgi:hypothetical protein
MMPTNLNELALADQFGHILFRQIENMPRHLSECRFFIFFDVTAFAFREAVDKERTSPFLIENYRSISARLPLTRSRNSLLEHATESRIDLTFLKTPHGIHEGRIRNLLLSCKPFEPRVLENSHGGFINI